MNRTDNLAANSARLATAEDVHHVLGEVDDITAAHILATQPTYQDLVDAALWVRGDGDLALREARQLSAGALAVAAMLTDADENEPTEEI